MCLIIVGNKNNVVKEQTILENALTSNSDGFGLMYFKNDEVISKKTLSKSFKDVTNLIQSVFNDIDEDSKLGLHFRFATQGTKDKINCHPLTVLSKEEHGRSIKLMHNSPMLPTAIIDKDRSDTHQFVKYYLRPVLKSNPDLIYNQKWLEQLNRDVDNSRLVFADGKSKTFVYVNKKLWTKKNKVWYSNENSFESRTFGFNSGYSYGNYKSNYDFCYEDDNKEDLNYNTKQLDFNGYESLDDYLDLPLDEELLSKLDENQIKDYVSKNQNEVVNFLEILKYDYLGYDS
jgi:predicted glutamine amidotransferase